MAFDVSAVTLLQPSRHLTSTETSGRRVEAHADRKTCTYRYRSSRDQELRRVKIGSRPATPVYPALVAGPRLRDLRESGKDSAVEAKADWEQGTTFCRCDVCRCIR